MLQSGVIPIAHNDLITDAAYDFYGERLATSSLDQRIKIWQFDESNGSWNVEDDWKAHDAAVSKLSWAHPEFGTIIASSSFDRTVKIWERVSHGGHTDIPQVNGTGPANSTTSSSRWVERAVLLDARGTVRSVEFAPHRLGLKLATISSDNFLRIYECLEQPSVTNWQLIEEVDVLSLPLSSSPTSHSRSHTLALATPTQTHVPVDVPHPHAVAQALQQQQTGSGGPSRSGPNNREADGGWCLSWCKEHYWGEVLAVACGVNPIVKIVHISASRRPTTILSLDTSLSDGNGSPAQHTTATTASDPDSGPVPFSVTTVAWAPSCGRSYHLLAAGGRDGHVRIFKIKPADDVELDETGEAEDHKWTASMVGDFDHHKSAVGHVEWNITGTILSSAGNDGRVRLWKATSGNVWRPAGSIGVEQTAEGEQDSSGESKDVDMDS
ncbi:hypothetical protein AX16_010457 [Volvariella volvacea WC 439]|nr:hypothetical protein AX16_010457 [Volvariella volvacea WC 439]